MSANIIIAALISASIAAPVAIERSVSVSYSIEDLTDQTRLETLEERIRFAARRVCEQDGLRQIAASSYDRSCYDRAVEDALRQIEDRRELNAESPIIVR